MNIQTLLEKIDLFNELVVESGFTRDINEYHSAIQQVVTQTNLVALKNIAEKVVSSLQFLHDSDLPEALDILFPEKTVFTNNEHLEALSTIINDPEIDTSTFFNKLNIELTALKTELESDTTELDELKATFSVYAKDDIKSALDDKAIMSIIFKDLQTITSLKKFSRALERWNRTLLIYHQLVSSKSPHDIELLEVQNGSIDVVFNFDVKVALDLTEIFKVAFYMFSAYLTYKTNLHKVIPEALMRNKKMMELEETREQLLLNDIKTEVTKKLKEQHLERRKEDRGIDKTSLTTKYEQVTELVLDHVVKGNDIKLLAAPKMEAEDAESEDNENEQTRLSRELREKSQEVQTLLKQLPESEIKLLADKYEAKEETEAEAK